MTAIKANGITIEYEAFGDRASPPVLLIMGLGAQLTLWDTAFCTAIANAGYFVIRYDNRDVGLSTSFDDASASPAYSMSDMAADAAGLLDALGIESAHIVGASMGGMIAQLVAADYPHKTLSLTSIMSTTGNPGLPRATPEALARLNTPAPDPEKDLEGFLDHAVEGARVMASRYPPDEAAVRARSLDDFRRCYYPVGFQRQYAGVMASPDRRPKLATITAPTVVIHGDADPLVPVE